MFHIQWGRFAYYTTIARPVTLPIPFYLLLFSLFISVDAALAPAAA
jgi:hypothetical protein